MFRLNILTNLGQNVSASCRRYCLRKAPEDMRLIITDKCSDDATTDFFFETFKEDPVVKLMKLEDFSDLRKYIDSLVCGGWKIKLVDKFNEKNIKGVVILAKILSDFYQNERNFAESCDAKTSRLINFWADSCDTIDWFKRFNVTQIGEIPLMATSKDARRTGICKLLVHEAILLGKKEGLPVIVGDSTQYAAKLGYGMGFTCLPPRHVLSFRDPEGRPWLPEAPPYPHDHITFVYKHI